MAVVENDNIQKQEPYEETDQFSRFMFGNNIQRETYKKGEYKTQEMPEQKEQSSFDSTTNQIDDWFFGLRRKDPATRTHTSQNQIENVLNNVDFELLMETIDMFITTSEQYKPLFKEFNPFLNRFIKKVKAK